MNTDNLSDAAEIKQKCIIDMSLTFSAMIRLFEEGSKQRMADKLYEDYQLLGGITTLAEFQSFHRQYPSRARGLG